MLVRRVIVEGGSEEEMVKKSSSKETVDIDPPQEPHIELAGLSESTKRICHRINYQPNDSQILKI